jgi:xanthine dehydrogenase accessory factor
MKDVFKIIEQELGKGCDAVLATIVSRKGSVPRGPGTRMAIRADGSFVGTIGGGKVEADVLSEASRIFREGKNRIIGFKLSGEKAAQADMICGGELEVYLELFSGNDASWRDFFKRVLDVRQKGQPALLATLLEEDTPVGPWESNYLYVPEEDRQAGDLPWLNPFFKAIPEILAKGQPVLWTIFEQDPGKRVFLEPLAVTPRLVIFGGGHVSAALCPLAKNIGFQVTVVDDRAEFADSLRFPEADELIVMPFEQADSALCFTPADFVVIMTRGHLHDHQVLRQVLIKPLGYIGMIGSRKKRETIFKALREEQFSEDLIKTVHTPIGLEIQAETPEEIAVSIAAELILVRARRRTVEKNNGKVSSPFCS